LAAAQPREGLRVADKGLEVADNTTKPVLHRLHGELVLMGDPTEAETAEASFRSAIEAARQQYTKLPELRASTSLARLLTKQDRRGEARAMLAATYNWFTESFDTPDLKEAKALLCELAT
jgi:predicted ATPase